MKVKLIDGVPEVNVIGKGYIKYHKWIPVIKSIGHLNPYQKAESTHISIFFTDDSWTQVNKNSEIEVIDI